MKLRDFLFIIFLTIFFSFLIFVTRNYFFGGIEDFENEIIEENYIEPVALKKISSLILSEQTSLQPSEQTSPQPSPFEGEGEDQILLNEGGAEATLPLDKGEVGGGIDLSSANKIKYTYVPKSLGEEKDVVYYRSTYNSFLSYNSVEEKISLLNVMLYKQKGEVRGKMQDKKVKLFGIYEMNLGEFLAVSIHEFAHFFDLYILQKKNGIDVSDYFYDISWKETKILKSSLTQKDFVSGYAMTNKYEDFAETFTYYVLHNSDFLEKSKNSSILKQKYDYFRSHIFSKNEFIDSLLKGEEEIKDYYRDITKIGFSLENFLQYLKK